MMKKILMISMFAALGLLMACNSESSKEVKSKKQETKKEVKSEAAAPAKKVAENKAVEKKGQKVLLSTKYGDMTLLLYDETPQHRDNFIKLVSDGFYDGTLFHRVIRNFMIQGGDPESKDAGPNKRLGSGGPGYTIEAEISPEFIHKKGALSAARQGDQANPEKRSSGSQFYVVQGKAVTAAELNQMAPRTGAIYTADQINTYLKVGGTPFLDNQYTVFGEVIDGLDVIDKIAAVKTQPGDRPVEDVSMTMKLIEN